VAVGQLVCSSFSTLANPVNSLSSTPPPPLRSSINRLRFRLTTLTTPNSSSSSTLPPPMGLSSNQMWFCLTTLTNLMRYFSTPPPSHVTANNSNTVLLIDSTFPPPLVAINRVTLWFYVTTLTPLMRSCSSSPPPPMWLSIDPDVVPSH
jgi:hypothetical protein